jgi:hypothetical protein
MERGQSVESLSGLALYPKIKYIRMDTVPELVLNMEQGQPVESLSGLVPYPKIEYIRMDMVQ